MSQQPYERLWARKHSKGLLWPILTMGFGTCVVFLYRGIRMRNTRWIGTGAAFLLVSVAITLIMPESTTSDGAAPSFAEDFALFLAISSWIGGSVLAFALNRIWLRFVADSEQQEAYQNVQAPPEQPRQAGSPNAASWKVPDSAPELPWQHRTPLPGVPDNPLRQLEVNTAKHEDFLRLGLPREVAIQLYSARIRVGYFVDYEHMLAVSGANPALVNPLQGRFDFS